MDRKNGDGGIGKLGSDVTAVTLRVLTLHFRVAIRAMQPAAQAARPLPQETPNMTEAIRTIARVRPLGMLAALLLCTALTACGGDSDNGNSVNPSPSTPEAVKPQMKCAP